MYGSPDDFAAFVDTLHQAGIGVILDWVPSHFPADAFALAQFDGSHLYEHADPRQRVQPDWQSWIFNYGRNEVRSFLVSGARFWLDRFHADGLRMDGVASMLYLDYSRQPGEWVANRFGGNENLEAIELLQECNTEVFASFPDVMSVAEESTAWPGVSRPVDSGGLGFSYKWDMGWMHDTLDYLAHDPVHRPWHHERLTFRSIYANSEHFVLPLSHDEVVHGKGSLIGRMAGDEWQQFANLRLLYGYQFTQPGKKLLFMGGEFAQRSEWNHDASLDWHLLELPAHKGVSAWVRRLNELYRSEACLHRDDLGDGGFSWIDCEDRLQSVLCYERHDGNGGVVTVVANFTPVPPRGLPRGHALWRPMGSTCQQRRTGVRRQRLLRSRLFRDNRHALARPRPERRARAAPARDLDPAADGLGGDDGRSLLPPPLLPARARRSVARRRQPGAQRVPVPRLEPEDHSGVLPPQHRCGGTRARQAPPRVA